MTAEMHGQFSPRQKKVQELVEKFAEQLSVHGVTGVFFFAAFDPAADEVTPVLASRFVKPPLQNPELMALLGQTVCVIARHDHPELAEAIDAMQAQAEQTAALHTHRGPLQ